MNVYRAAPQAQASRPRKSKYPHLGDAAVQLAGIALGLWLTWEMAHPEDWFPTLAGWFGELNAAIGVTVLLMLAMIAAVISRALSIVRVILRAVIRWIRDCA